jgi:hypothetical protein
MPRRALVAILLLVPLGLLGALSGFAASSPTAGFADAPLKTMDYPDPTGDNPSSSPDITNVLIENWADGTLGFKVSLPRETAFVLNRGVGIYIDSDANRTTGQFGDDYFIAVSGRNTGDATFGLYSWTGTTWTPIPSASLKAEFRPSDGVLATINKGELSIGSTFNVEVWGSVVSNTSVYFDQAPQQPNYFTYELGVAPTTSAATTTTATTTPAAKTQQLTARVGPGAKIAFARSARVGKAVITINDLSTKDDFHLTGPGVNKKTGIAFKGVTKWTVTLRKANYSFRSDAHTSLHGTLKVS